MLRYHAEPAFIEDGKVKGIVGHTDPGALENFAVEGHRDAKYPSDRLYPQFRYREPYSVDLERAEAMVKVLRKVDRRVRQLIERFGWPDDAAGYTAYVADAIGATSEQPFVRLVELAKDPAGLGYRTMSARALADWLRTEERKWEEKHGVKREGDE